MTATTHDPTQEWLHSFREYGFGHVPQLLSAQEVTHYRTAALQSMNGRTNDVAAVGLRTTIDGWQHSGGRPGGRARRAGLSDLFGRLAPAADEYDLYLYAEWPELRWTPRVTVPMRASDVTFHHRRTAHSAGANHTPDDRVSTVIAFIDAAAT